MMPGNDALEVECEHDVQPVNMGADWGRCTKCGEHGFPMTERAAYGEVQCRTCHDTGLVPMTNPTRPGAFADGPCPDCAEPRPTSRTPTMEASVHAGVVLLFIAGCLVLLAVLTGAR